MPVSNFVWDELSDNVLMEVDDIGTTTAEYTNEPSQIGKLISQRRDSTDSYFHFDARRSTRQLTSENETETDSYSYSAFGVVVARSGTTENPFQYNGAIGYYTDQESGEVYVRTRSYKPRIGRWLSVDSLLFIDGPNLYVYVRNQPNNSFDLVGTRCEDCKPEAKLLTIGNSYLRVAGKTTPDMITFMQTYGLTPDDVLRYRDKYFIVKCKRGRAAGALTVSCGYIFANAIVETKVRWEETVVQRVQVTHRAWNDINPRGESKTEHTIEGFDLDAGTTDDVFDSHLLITDINAARNAWSANAVDLTMCCGDYDGKKAPEGLPEYVDWGDGDPSKINCVGQITKWKIGFSYNNSVWELHVFNSMPEIHAFGNFPGS